MYEDLQKTSVSLSGGDFRKEPVVNRLKRQRKEFQDRVNDLDDAIDKLEKNPQVGEILEALNKLGHY